METKEDRAWFSVVEKNKLKRLESAALSGNLEEVIHLARNIPIQTPESYDILVKAISARQFQSAQILLENGWHLSRHGYFHEGFEFCNDNSLLHLAIAAGFYQLVQILLHENINVCLLSSDKIPLIFKVVDYPSHFSESLQILEDLIVKGASLTDQYNTFSILHYAARRGNAKIIPILVEKKCPVNFQAFDGSTPLHIAAKFASPDVVKVLLHEGADYTLKDSNNITPLMTAIQSGSLETFKRLFVFGCHFTPYARIISPKVNINKLVYFATSTGSVEILKLILPHAPSVNCCSLNPENSALALAISNKNLEIAQLLTGYEIGFDQQIFQEFVSNNQLAGKSAGNLAGEREFQNILHIDETKGQNAVLDLNSGNHASLSQMILQYDFRSRVDAEGNTALHVAVREQDMAAIVGFLGRLGPSLHITNKFGYTALELATLLGFSSIVYLFLQTHPESFFLPRNKNHSPMHLAAQTENFEIMRLFFQKALTADVFETLSWTPLHIAIERQNIDLVLMLLQNGASSKGSSNIGSALFTAAQIGNTEIFKILTPFGNIHDPVLLYVAAFYGNEEIVRLLLNCGVGPNSMDDKYLTPLHAAAQNGHERIVVLLLEHGAHVDPGQENDKKEDNEQNDKKGNDKQNDKKENDKQNDKKENDKQNDKKQENDKNEDENKSDEIVFIDEELVEKMYLSTPLLAATHAGHRRITELLLTHGANVYAELYESFESHVHYSEKHASKCENILLHGSYKFSEIGSNGTLRGYSAIHLAIEAGNEELIDLLISYNASVNACIRRGISAVDLAIELENCRIIPRIFATRVDERIFYDVEAFMKNRDLRMNPEFVSVFINCVTSRANFQNRDYYVLMENAIVYEFEMLVEILLQKRPGLLMENESFEFLQMAIERRNSLLARLLLEYGIGFSEVEKEGKSILLAIETNQMKVIEFILEVHKISLGLGRVWISQSVFETCFTNAILTDRAGIVELLLTVCVQAWTFDLAIRVQSAEVIEKFLNLDIADDVRNRFLEDALFFSVYRENVGIVKFLLRRGVRLDAITPWGLTVIFAAMQQFESLAGKCMIQMLLHYGADLNWESKKGLIPFETLFVDPITNVLRNVNHNFRIVLKMCLLNGLHFNRASRMSVFRPLLFGLLIKDPEVVKFLLVSGTQVDYFLEDDRLGFHIATRNYYFSMLDYLRRGENSPKRYFVNYRRSAKIVVLLIQEVARLLSLDKKVLKRILNYLQIGWLFNYYLHCRREINLMKVTKICEGLTYYDVLVASKRNLTLLAKNKDVRLILLPGSEVGTLFPEYAEVLKERIGIGFDRVCLMKSAYELLNKAIGSRFRIIYETVENVSKFLSNRDLQNLIAACTDGMFI